MFYVQENASGASLSATETAPQLRGEMWPATLPRGRGITHLLPQFVWWMIQGSFHGSLCAVGVIKNSTFAILPWL